MYSEWSEIRGCRLRRAHARLTLARSGATASATREDFCKSESIFKIYPSLARCADDPGTYLSSIFPVIRHQPSHVLAFTCSDFGSDYFKCNRSMSMRLDGHNIATKFDLVKVGPDDHSTTSTKKSHLNTCKHFAPHTYQLVDPYSTRLLRS